MVKLNIKCTVIQIGQKFNRNSTEIQQKFYRNSTEIRELLPEKIHRGHNPILEPQTLISDLIRIERSHENADTNLIKRSDPLCEVLVSSKCG